MLEPSISSEFNTETLKKKLPAEGEALSLACFDYLENNFTRTERINFEKKILVFPVAKAELAALASTVLEPDLHLIFPYKQKLKRFAFPLFFGYAARTVLGVAAATIIYFGIRTAIETQNFASDLNQSVAINDSMLIPQLNNSNKKIELPYSKEQIQKIKSQRSSNKANLNQNASRKNTSTGIKLAANTQVTEQPTMQELLLNPLNAGQLLTKNALSTEKINIQTLAMVFPKNTVEESSEYKSITNVLIEKFKRNVLKIDQKTPINAMVLAESGINGIGKMTNSFFQLKTQKNSDGKPTYWAFEAGKFSIERQIKKNISE